MGDEQVLKQSEVKQAPEAIGSAVTQPDATAPVDGKPVALKNEEASDSIMSEFLLFLKEEKKWWLAPLVLVLIALGGIIIFAEGSAIAPFIYTIF
jgi:hypothetical protein